MRGLARSQTRRLEAPRIRSFAVRPVVKFLVRPSGLKNYYRMRAALLLTKLDVDHELIDEDDWLELPKW